VPVPRLVDDDVRFTVYRPDVLAPEQWASMLVFAHKTSPVEQAGRPPLDPLRVVADRASALFGDHPPAPVSVDARNELPRGVQLRIVPSLPGLQCNPPEATLDWWEPVHEAAFRVRAGAHLNGAVVRGAIRIWCGPLIFGEVAVAIRVAAGTSPSPAYAEPARISPYRKIFPSYSHHDRDIVTRFAESARALGDSYLQDVLTLRAGEEWNPRILQVIGEADVFQLFWSRYSMRSLHCRQEWEHALALGRPSFVRPLYWEDPLPEDSGQGLPPAALRALHFVHVPVQRTPAVNEQPDTQARLQGPAPALSAPQAWGQAPAEPASRATAASAGSATRAYQPAQASTPPGPPGYSPVQEGYASPRGNSPPAARRQPPAAPAGWGVTSGPGGPASAAGRPRSGQRRRRSPVTVAAVLIAAVAAVLVTLYLTGIL
jgi:hypothetical protein